MKLKRERKKRRMGGVQNGSADGRAERKRERVGSWDRRQRSPLGLVVAAPTSSSPRKRSRESGARQPVGGAGQASLVRVKLKTGSRGKYKAEPAAGRGGGGLWHAAGMQPRGNFYSR